MRTLTLVTVDVVETGDDDALETDDSTAREAVVTWTDEETAEWAHDDGVHGSSSWREASRLLMWDGLSFSCVDSDPYAARWAGSVDGWRDTYTDAHRIGYDTTARLDGWPEDERRAIVAAVEARD